MTVKSNPAGVTLTGTDTDGQTVTLNMGSNWFAQSATESGYLNIDVRVRLSIPVKHLMQALQQKVS